MKGIVRKIDELGRITLPMEYRRSLGIEPREQAQIGMYIANQVIYMVKVDKQYIGIVRSLDELGRYTLPIEVRRTLDFEDRQKVDIWFEDGIICLAKYVPEAPGCVICGGTEQLMDIEGVHICRDCGCKVIDKYMED